MKYLKLIVVGFVMSLLAACSNDDDSSINGFDSEDSISDEPFSGTIDGESITFQEAKGEITFLTFVDGEFVTGDVEKLNFQLSSTEFECGANLIGQANHVFGTIETETIGFQLTDISTSILGEGINTQSGGLVELVSINETEAVIKIKTSGDLYSLEGKFTVAICPTEEEIEE